jgi:glycerol-3-phosphate dehydrogenase
MVGASATQRGAVRAIHTDVLVIGGGATGAGVVRDAAMRGFRTVLVERVDLGQGTTGRFHGLLHSGGRYVTSDPQSARECAQEVETLHRIGAEVIEPTGGLFVTTPHDDPEYADRFITACHETGVQAQEIPVGQALRREPRLNPQISRAFEVNDCAVDAWKLIWGNVRSAQEYGATILPYHWVTQVLRDGDAVIGAVCRDDIAGEAVRIEAAFTVNASGAWAGQLADLAGCPGVTVVPGRGIMIAMNHRLVNTVVNRCAPPGDGDIIVPIRTVCVIGTTDSKADSPDELEITHTEVQQMLDAGEILVPGFRDARALHAWAGARPLFKDERASESDTRHMSRGLALVDHKPRDGVTGFLTITGGKATTFRLMAETVVDAMCAQMGETRPCRTAHEPFPGSEDGKLYWLGSRLDDHEARRGTDQIICECELMPRRKLEELLARRPSATFDDVRRQLRLGMGPCQGGFCSYRTTGIAHELGCVDADRANLQLRSFLEHRWIGLHPILYGDQVRQTALDDWIFQGLLDVEHLPDGAPA